MLNNLQQMKPDVMRAVVFKGVRKVCVEERPVPKIQDSLDVIVKVTYSALCGRLVPLLLFKKYLRIYATLLNSLSHLKTITVSYTVRSYFSLSSELYLMYFANSFSGPPTFENWFYHGT